MRTVTLFVAGICTLLCIECKAQGIEKTNIVSFVSSEYKSMISLDVDNNGVIDLVTANEQIQWFEGTASITLGAAHILDVTFSDYIQRLDTEDINNDGYPDMYYYLGGYPYEIGFVLNPGIGETTWLQYQIPGSYSDAIGFIDVDSDGDKDFVFEDNLSHLGYRANTDNTFETLFSIPDSYPALFFYFHEDIDKDGDVDWAGYFDDCCTKYFSNNGNGTFTATTTSGDEYMSNIYNLDVDNDGYSDLVYYHSGGTFEVSYFSPVSNSFGPQVYLGDITTYFNGYFFRDVDADGDIDIVISVPETDPDYSYNTYRWISNPGAGVPLQINDDYLLPLIPETPYYSYSKGFFDITNDGAPDLLFNESDETGYQLLLYENDPPAFHIPDTATLPYFPDATEVLCFDMDADPDNDLLMGFNNGSIGWMEFDHLADSFSIYHEILHLPDYPNVLNIKKKDLDDDGDFDLITSFAGYFGGGITYYSLNDGLGNFTNYNLSNQAFMNIWLMDADEDGDLDFTGMLNSYEHNLVYYENVGAIDAMFAYADDVSSLAVWNTFVDIDIDEDGDMDMIGGRDYTSQVKSFINEDGAGAFTVQSNYFTAECNDVRSLFASDFDNDGDQDIVYTCELGAMYLSRNDEGTHTQIPIGTFDPTMIADGSHTALFDLNMDGFEDLIYNKIAGGSGYKLATGPGTFDDDYTAFSSDYGRFNNVDAGSVPDFIGIDESQLYIQYNILMLAPSFEVSVPTKNYLAEGNDADSITILFDEIPQSALDININPSSEINAGAGAGVSYTITIPADETALLPIVVHFTIPDDTIVEDIATGLISISADPETWGMYTELLNVNIDYTTVDNDLGLFFSPATINFTEGTSSDTVYAHINIVLEETANIQIIENALYNGGFGAYLADSYTLGTGLDAITPFKFTTNTVNDFVYNDDIATSFQLVFYSDDLVIDGFLPAEIPVYIIEDDTFGINTLLSTTELSEGIESATIDLSPLSATTETILVTLTPDEYLDLGNGPGIAVTLTFAPGTEIPEMQSISAFAVENYIAEGTHIASMVQTISSDDAFYGSIAPFTYAFTISDNDLPQGITFTPPVATTYLEGTTDISMSFALWTNPAEIVQITAQPDVLLDLGAGAGNPITITFDPMDDATIPQVIAITAVNNTIIGPETATSNITFEINTTDLNLVDETIDPITLTIQDEDILQGIQIAAPAPITYVEGEEEITMSLLLNTIPNSAVTINCYPDGQLDLGGGAGVPVAFILEGADATIPHELLISILDDAIIEGPHSGFITFEIITDDPVVVDATIAPIELSIEDNDLPQNVIIVFDALYHMEGESLIPLSTALESTPAFPVDLLLSPAEEIDLGAGYGVAVNIHFNADASAMTPQEIYVSVAENFIVDGDRTSNIIAEISTLDPALIDYIIPSIPVYIHDNDILQGVNITTPDGTPYPEGTLDIPIAVSLFTIPNAPVSIIADYDAVQLSMAVSTLNFATDGTAMESQYFHLSVNDDLLAEGDHFAMINYTIATDDPQFDGYTIPFVIVNISDNDIESAIYSITTSSLPSAIMTSGAFQIHVSDAFNGSTYAVFALNGQQVTGGSISGNILSADAGHLSAGRYVLGIIMDKEILQIPLILTH